MLATDWYWGYINSDDRNLASNMIFLSEVSLLYFPVVLNFDGDSMDDGASRAAQLQLLQFSFDGPY